MLKNIGSNWFLMAVTGLATFFLMPFNLGHLGSAQYGIWLVIAGLTAYLSLLHLGVPMASVRHMTQAIAAKDTLQLNRVVASCAALYLGLGLMTGLLGLALLVFFEATYAVPIEMSGLARLAFILSLLQTAIGFVAYMPYAILSAYQSFVPKNAIMVAAVLVRIAVNIFLALLFPNLVTLAVVMLVTTLFELVVAWGYIFVTFPEIRPRSVHVRLATIREMMGFSAYVFLMALGGQLAFQSSVLVIGHAMTSADVVSFAIPNSLMLILMQFVTGIASVIMPLATSLQATGKKDELRSILFRWTKISLALSWCAGLFLFVFGPEFLHFWIKSAYTAEAGRALRILMASYLVYLPVRGVALPMLMGLGKAKWLTIATLAGGILCIALSLIWVRRYGIEGVAWAVFVHNILVAGAMAWLICHELRIPLRLYFNATVPLSMIGGFAGLVLLGWWHYTWHPSGLFGLGLAGLLTLVISGGLWAGLVLRHDPHVVLPRFADLLRGRLA
jgi:O-antigen/teichoic acid export membrane protein